MKREEYSAPETADRFQRLLKAAIKTRPMPIEKKKKEKAKPSPSESSDASGKTSPR